MPFRPSIILAVFFLMTGAFPATADEPVYVSEPVVPSITPALRDLPDTPDMENLMSIEGKQRDTHGIFVPELDFPPHDNPLAKLQSEAQPADSRTQKAFGTTIVNVKGLDYGVPPPDPTGDVGPNHVVQGVNGSSGSVVRVLDKTGATLLANKSMETLATASPCTNGYCDPIILYDRAADRWLISEFDSSIDNLCVYVSTSPDPTGTYYYYPFNPPGTDQDYPHYGVWPAADNSAYFVGANNGGYVIALERDKMLAGQTARLLSFTVTGLSGWGFQLTMPANHAGATLPPSSSGGFFLRPRDTEIHGGTCTNCDLMEIWEFKVTWGSTPTGSFTQLTSAQLTDWDQTVCGTTQFGCMPQSGTTRLLDPIREPIHFPLQYRNWSTHETLVGGFVEDVDGTNQSAVHWFELRRTPPGSGNWTKYQEGVLANDAYHRGVTSVAMDGSGNIALGYTRTSGSSYAGAYYAGRLSTDTLGTLSSVDNTIQAGTSYQSTYDRWGDYAGMGVDPADDCTFWFFGMYEEGANNSATNIASFKFDQCGTCTAPGAPNLTAAAGDCSGVNLAWSAGTGTTLSYNVYRKEGTCGGTYAKIAGPVTGTTYADTSAVGGTQYAYVIKGACDGGGVNESAYSNCRTATRLATPAAPTGVAATDSRCTDVQVTWNTASGATGYNVLRGTVCGTAQNTFTGVTSPYTDASAVAGTSYQYWVVALNGSCAGPASACDAGVRLAVPTAPAAPALTPSCTSVALSWSAVSGASDYEVWRNPGANCTGATQVVSTTGGATTYTNTGLTTGTQYSYFIKAKNACGTSANGACATTTTLATPAAPGAPALTPGCTSVALSWSAVSGASDYEVWRNPGANCTGATQVVSTTGGATTYTNTGLTGNAQYSYYIKAKNACGTSANGACSTTTTVCLPNIVYLSHGVPAQITGDGDGNAEPGEKYSVVVTLRNTGDAGATAVTAQLAGNGITVCNNPGLYGAMAVGGTAVYTFEFVIDDDFEASFGCGTDIGFDIVTKTCTELTPAGANESDAFSATVGENLGGGTPVDLAIQPSIADTYIQQDSSSTNYGTASTLYVTSLRQQGTQRNRRALLNFDLSSIPAGSTINTAQLELYCTAAASDTRTLNVHYLSTAWTETGATWTNMSANYNATVQSSIAAGITTGWKIWTGLATLVQNWHDGAVANHGLMLQDNTENNQGERTYQFASNDYTTNPAYQPILRINYTPPGGGWDCSDVAAGTCAAAAPPEVSGIPDHRLKAAKNTDPALVDLRFEEVGASHYQVYVSKTAATAPFLVTNPAEGDALCSLSGWTGPDAEGMLTLTGVDLDAGLTGEAPALFFLVTGDNGFAAEGPLGFATGPVVRTADSYCNR